MHAVRRSSQDIKGKKVWVIGAGTIGNLVAQSAKGLGAEAVLISDASDYKLTMAQKCNVEYAVNIQKQDIRQELLEQFGEDGADVVFECSVNENALNEALELTRKGIDIVIVGVYEKFASINLANVQDREYSLIGSLMYTEEDYLSAISLAQEGKVNMRGLISKEFYLKQTAEAYKYIERNKDQVQKVILKIED